MIPIKTALITIYLAGFLDLCFKFENKETSTKDFLWCCFWFIYRPLKFLGIV